MASILILGGGIFLGKHLTVALQGHGHQITHFNRGRTGVAPPGVALVRGDRRFDLAALGSRSWDAVVDTCGYHPREADVASRYFSARTGRYVFISTISVYDASHAPIDEDTATLPLERNDYGALKAGCERVVASTFRQRATILRPGLIVGPDDPTDRFTAWPLRFARGGNVLVPQSPSFATQFIDVRDLAAFVVHLIECDRAGTYNATSPIGAHNLGEVFAACIQAVRAPSRLHWATPDFLQSQNIGEWIDMPLWIPESAGIPGQLSVDVGRALVAGLRFRSLLTTVIDTLGWARTWPRERLPIAGLSPQREARALDALGVR